MKPHVSFVAVAAALTVCALLPAQRLPLPGDPSRCLQLIDLGAEKGQGPELVLVNPGDDATARKAAAKAAEEAALIAFLRGFVQPPLQAGDDVQLLGGRWLAVLGSPEQGACAEQIVRAARARPDDLITTELTVFQVDGDLFAKAVAPLLPAADAAAKGPRRAVIDAAATTALREAMRAGTAEVIESPRLATRPLQSAEVSHITDTAYVKDFTVTKQDGSVIAEPVIGTVQDGVRCKTLAACTGKDRIGISCWLTKADLQKPIPTFTTTIGVSTPVQIQLPEVRTIELQQTAELPPGSSALIATPKSDGRWLLALVQATVQKK